MCSSFSSQCKLHTFFIFFHNLSKKFMPHWCSSSMFFQSATSASLNSVYFGRLALGIVQLYTILQRKGPFQRHNTSTLLLCATPLLKWIHNKSKWYIMPSFFIVVGLRKNTFQRKNEWVWVPLSRPSFIYI